MYSQVSVNFNHFKLVEVSSAHVIRWIENWHLGSMGRHLHWGTFAFSQEKAFVLYGFAVETHPAQAAFAKLQRQFVKNGHYYIKSLLSWVRVHCEKVSQRSDSKIMATFTKSHIYESSASKTRSSVFKLFANTNWQKTKLTLPGLCRFKLIHFHVSIVCCAVEVSFYHAQYRHGVHGSFLNLNGLVTPGSNRWLFPKIRRTRISSIQQYCTPCWQISPNFYSSKIP